MTEEIAAPETRDGIEKFEINWQGIAVEIRFERNWLGDTSEFQTAHLEIVATAPERQPLPMTETGYRSHFLAAAEIDEARGCCRLCHGMARPCRQRQGMEGAERGAAVAQFVLSAVREATSR